MGTAVSTALKSYYPDAQGAGSIGALAGLFTYVGTVIAPAFNRGVQSEETYAANSPPTTLGQGDASESPWKKD